MAWKTLGIRDVALDSALWYGVGTFVFLALTFLYSQADADPTGMTYLILLMVVQITPAVLMLPRRRYNYLTFILVNHCITYSVAEYNLITNVHKSAFVPKATVRAIQETLYSTVLLAASYCFWRYVIFQESMSKKSRCAQFRLSRSAYTACACFSIFFPLTLNIGFQVFGTYYWAVDGCALMLLYTADAPSPMAGRFAKLALLFSAYYYFLETGSLQMMGTLASVILLSTLLNLNVRGLVTVLLLGALATAIQTVKYEYRVATRDNPVHGLIERASILSGLLLWKLFNGEPVDADEDDNDTELTEDNAPNDNVSDSLAKGFARIGDDSLERVLDWTPTRVPFWGGETYSGIPFIFIPRFLWPDKPQRDFWNKFGRSYGFIAPNDMTTSVGVGFMAEGYMNFGFTGLYTISCLFGLMAAVLEWVACSLLGAQNNFVYLVLLIPLTSFATDLSSIINSEYIALCMLLPFRSWLSRLLNRDVYAYDCSGTHKATRTNTASP